MAAAIIIALILASTSTLISGRVPTPQTGRGRGLIKDDSWSYFPGSQIYRGGWLNAYENYFRPTHHQFQRALPFSFFNKEDKDRAPVAATAPVPAPGTLDVGQPIVPGFRPFPPPVAVAGRDDKLPSPPKAGKPVIPLTDYSALSASTVQIPIPLAPTGKGNMNRERQLLPTSVTPDWFFFNSGYGPGVHADFGPLGLGGDLSGYNQVWYPYYGINLGQGYKYFPLTYSYNPTTIPGAR